MSLEFRHIASYLIWYSSHHLCEDLLHEVILCVGYFTVLHPDNQVGTFVIPASIQLLKSQWLAGRLNVVCVCAREREFCVCVRERVV